MLNGHGKGKETSHRSQCSEAGQVLLERCFEKSLAEARFRS